MDIMLLKTVTMSKTLGSIREKRRYVVLTLTLVGQLHIQFDQESLVIFPFLTIPLG